jgi:RNA polymerase sigma-70 factor (ECF subfamily)
MATTEIELMGRIGAGDRRAFASLYDRFAPRVFGLALRLLRSHSDAEDVLQDTFLRVWSLAGRFDPARCGPDGWVLMIARCRAIDRLRRKPIAVGDDVPEPVVDTPADQEPQRREEAERVAGALAGLTHQQAAAIRLAYFAGLTHEQIACRLGCPLGTVKTRIRLGLIRLRERLREPDHQVREGAAGLTVADSAG